jgi:hypothetical protein
MKTLLHILPFIFVGAVVGYSLDRLFTDTRPPVVAFTHAEALNSPIDAGEDLYVRVFRTKVRDDCPVTALRFATNQSGDTFDLPDVISAEGGSPNSDYFEGSYTIPDNLPSGFYRVSVHLIYDCGRGGVFHYDQPEILFEVL